jgi:hypothetical protein
MQGVVEGTKFSARSENSKSSRNQLWNLMKIAIEVSKEYPLIKFFKMMLSI